MKKSTYINLVIIAAVILLAILPLFLQAGAEFGGADGEAEAAITEINKEYEPWVSSFWEPPSGEIESLLFALQASLGTAVIAYGFGYMKGRKKKESE